MQPSNFLKGAAFAVLLVGLGGLAISQTGKVSASSVQAEAPAATVQAHQAVLRGTFSGLSDHATNGDVTIVKQGDGYLVVLGENFSLDGAPDPVVGFGRDGEYIVASQAADLRSKRGAQTYQLPTSFQPEAYNEIYIWCEKFSVPLGVAKLTNI